MKRSIVAVVLGAVLVVGVVPTARAASVSVAEFSGFFIFHNGSLPLPFATATEQLEFTTKNCTEAAAHALKPKPPATTGTCDIKATGVLTGNCVSATGVGSGSYVDSRRQLLQFTLTIVVAGPTWHWSGTITKGRQSGTFHASGTWQPAGGPCNPIGTTGTFAYTLT